MSFWASTGLLTFLVVVAVVAGPTLVTALEQSGWGTPSARLDNRETWTLQDTTRIEVHTVRRGETLNAIARRYGVRDTQALADHNGLQSADRIEVRQRLRIPNHLRELDASSAGRSVALRGHRHDGGDRMTKELKTGASSDALHATTARLLLAAFVLLFVGGVVVAALRPSEANRRCLQGPLTGDGHHQRQPKRTRHRLAEGRESMSKTPLTEAAATNFGTT